MIREDLDHPDHIHLELNSDLIKPFLSYSEAFDVVITYIQNMHVWPRKYFLKIFSKFLEKLLFLEY